MEKRALLAITLSLAIYILYFYFFVPQPINKPNQSKENISKSEKTESIVDDPNRGINQPIIANYSSAPQLPLDIQKLIESQNKRFPQEIPIITDLYEAKISTDRGIITSWTLKNFFLSEGVETSLFSLKFLNKILDSYKRYFSSLFNENEIKSLKIPIDLIQSNEPGEVLRLVNKFESDNQNKHNTELYEANLDSIKLDHSLSKETLSLSYVTPNGLKITKLLTFYNGSYKFDMEVITENLTNYRQTLNYQILLNKGLGNVFQSKAHKYEGPLSWINGEKVKDKPGKGSQVITHEGNIGWTAMTSNYFLTACLPQDQISQVIVQRPPTESGKDVLLINRSTIINLKYPERLLESGSSKKDYYSFYFGPKITQHLKSTNQNLEQAIDYGFFHFLAKPLILLLREFYKIIPNYGLAIILLTVIIKLIFWPLTDKSFRSMKDMQDLQPKLAAIKEKFKNDPTKLNQEIMGMYKQKGVNPFGGCLPLLLQIPVFFALYEGLMVSIEMRSAPFIFWIKDLSAMDPLLITPIIMGITMYIQQKMTPISTDNAQMKMMTYLPLLFTFFFLSFPSGLVLYWLLNNILTIGQHYLILKKCKA